MFRLVAYNHTDGAGGAGTTTTFDPVDAEPDPHIHVSGDSIFVPNDTNEIMAFWGFSGSWSVGETAVVSRMKLAAPSLSPSLGIPTFQIPAAAAAELEEPDTPLQLNNYIGRNIRLVPSEGIQMHVMESVAGDDRQAMGLLWLGNGVYGNPYPNLPMTTVRFTAAVTCTAYNWVNGAITFEEDLPAGSYAVMGMHVISASGIAARLVFNNQGPRPGVVAFDAIEDQTHPMFRNGNLGVFGTFHHSTPPTLDMLCRTTDTAQEGWLDLVRIG